MFPPKRKIFADLGPPPRRLLPQKSTRKRDRLLFTRSNLRFPIQGSIRLSRAQRCTSTTRPRQKMVIRLRWATVVAHLTDNTSPSAGLSLRRGFFLLQSATKKKTLPTRTHLIPRQRYLCRPKITLRTSTYFFFLNAKQTSISSSDTSMLKRKTTLKAELQK
jgi:hypothetical protein